MNTANHLSQDDLALFALQLLPEDETHDALTHLQHCETCRSEVGEFQGDLALYSMGSEMHTPPAPARERLLRSVALEKRVATAETPVPAAAAAVNGAVSASASRHSNVVEMEPGSTQRRARASWIPWTGWAVAAALAVAAGLQSREREKLEGDLNSEHARFLSLQQSAAGPQLAVAALTDPGALNVVLHQPAAKGAPAAPLLPEGHAAYLPDRGALVFVATNMEPLKPYKVYELWLLPAEPNAAPIPAGSFRPDTAGHASVVLPTGPKLISIKGFGVTLEDDKVPPRQPTLPILLLGSAKA